jgi:hypothetical protein
MEAWAMACCKPLLSSIRSAIAIGKCHFQGMSYVVPQEIALSLHFLGLENQGCSASEA